MEWVIKEIWMLCLKRPFASLGFVLGSTVLVLLFNNCGPRFKSTDAELGGAGSTGPAPGQPSPAPSQPAGGTVEWNVPVVPTFPSGRTIPVPKGANPSEGGQNLRAALSQALPGDTLVLEAGATYGGSFELPYKDSPVGMDPSSPNHPYITIRTSSPDSNLPGSRVRVDPARDSALLAKIYILNGNTPAFSTELRSDGKAAHHYRLLGLEIAPAQPGVIVPAVSDTTASLIPADLPIPQILAYGIVALGRGPGQDTLQKVAHHFIIDRCFIHGLVGQNVKFGVALNSAESWVVNSYVSEVHSSIQDSQAIAGYNGPGPFHINNNYLEGGAENVMFGGATSVIPDLVPTQIEFRHNHFRKPVAWQNWEKVDSATYAATPVAQRARTTYGSNPANFRYLRLNSYTPVIKNLFEIKNGQDVVLDANILENNWIQADQHGMAIVLTPRVEGCTQPWAVAQRITFTRNIIRHVGSLVGFLGVDGNCQTGPRTNHVTFKDNLVYDINFAYAYDFPRVIQFPGVDFLTFDHNTILHDDGNIIRNFTDSNSSGPSQNFVYTNNITQYGVSSGWRGASSDCGTDSAGLSGASCFAQPQFAGNVIIGNPTATFPAGNFTPSTLSSVGFSGYMGGLVSEPAGLQVVPTSIYYKKGLDGMSPGANVEAVLDATLGVIEGR